MNENNNYELSEILNILKHRNYRKIIKTKNIHVIGFVPFATSEEEAIYCLKCNIDEMPICEYVGCSNKKAFRSYPSKEYYSEGCCYDHTSKVKNILNYGVENISQLDTVKEKKKNSNLTNFGVENPKQHPDIAKKIADTMQVRYGGFGKGGSINQKIESTMIQKYGTTNPMQTDVHREKMMRTLFNKIVDRLKDYVEPMFAFEDYLGSDATQQWKCKCCDTIFLGKIDNGLIPRCTVCYPITAGVSKLEMELFEKIQYPDKTQNDKSVLGGKELDIYIPSKNIAIEFNGIYWHSELNGKDKNYHLKKTERCSEKGIQLIHVFEDEWYEKREIILSIIHAKLGLFENRIYARQCVIRELSNSEKMEFLDKNHLQGDDKSSVKIGLFYNSSLVALMTFGHSRYNRNYQYEMHRFCSKAGYQIVGGASKLWKYFLKTCNPESVITYADRRYSDGTFYTKIGFRLKSISDPNFFVLDSNKTSRQSRLGWQKHKLKEKLDHFDENLTAWENMQIAGYDRIWDCGNFVFEWKKDYK